MTPLQIIHLVEQQYQLPNGSIIAYNRRKRTAEARAVALVLSRRYCTHSYPELGEIFNRDHSTLISLKTSPSLQRDTAKRVIVDISGYIKRQGH